MPPRPAEPPAAFFSFCWIASTPRGSSPTPNPPNSSIASANVRPRARVWGGGDSQPAVKPRGGTGWAVARRRRWQDPALAGRRGGRAREQPGRPHPEPVGGARPPAPRPHRDAREGLRHLAELEL